MNSKIKQAFRSEMSLARRAYVSGELSKSFSHLERAHILGQRWIGPHTLSHWWMLKVGVRRADIREIAGQILRILASLVISRVWVPIGNTGGADVSPLEPMPLPEDLREILQGEDAAA